MNEDYVRTARAKGLSERQVMVRHVLRNSMLPIVTLWGLDFGAVVGGGAILTETVFDLQGVGQYTADAIAQLDVPPLIARDDARRVHDRPLQRDRRHPLRAPRSADPARGKRIAVSTAKEAPPAQPTRGEPILTVENLRVSFQTESGLVKAVDDVSFTLGRGEVLAIVGESGSGKSVTAMTLMGLTRGANAWIEGKVAPRRDRADRRQRRAAAQDPRRASWR